MNARYPPLSVKVWGELACFTRPEMKVERVSYPAPTAGAARGILEAIFWKPEFTWRVEEVWLLSPIRYFSILRNEVNSRASERAAQDRLNGGPAYDAAADRTQRHTLALRDVAYIIRAQVELKPGVTADEAKFRDQFHRRVRDGRCFATPYLGCREFSAAFCEPDGRETPIALTDDLGLMLWDLRYIPDPDPDKRGRGAPRFFRARLERGVLRFPDMAPGEEG